MNCLAEKIIGDTPDFGFSIDRSVTRIREHSIALDRCKRFSEIPRISFEINLKPLEWAVFAYYYSLAPNNHPSELTASTHLKIGRNNLAATLESLASKGLVFFDIHARSKLRIVNISHPKFWNRDPNENDIGPWTNPAAHVPRLFPSLPERANDARDSAHEPGQHVRLPYLLFHTLIHPTSKFLYGLLCYLGVNTHPTTQQLAAAMQCSQSTAATRVAELEEYRMIYSDAREPLHFGEHTRYFHHLTDVAFWKTRKAEFWYPGGEKSLIARLDAAGFPGQRNIRRSDETDDFRPYADASQVLARAIPRQKTAEVRQAQSQIRQDVEASQVILSASPEGSQETAEVRQISSQIRQIRLQRRQNRSQIRQIRLQHRQNRSQSSEKPQCSPCTEARAKETALAKNSYIRNQNNKNTVRNEPRVRERWAPVDASFHPRLINIAQAASIAWRDRDYRWDRALWNGTVEKIALESGEQEAVRFVSYVKDANAAWGREFPYSPQLMQAFLVAFRAGKHWASILGAKYEERAKTGTARDDGNPDAGSGSQNQVVTGSEPADRPITSTEPIEMLPADPGATHSGSAGTCMDPEIIPDPRAPVAVVEATPDPRAPVAAEISPAETKQTPSAGVKKPKPVQLTHANLLDFPARSATREPPTNQAIARADAKPAEPSPRRLQLEKAITALTSGMRSQSRDSLKRGFAKLDDDALHDTVCRLFGADRLNLLVPS